MNKLRLHLQNAMTGSQTGNPTVFFSFLYMLSVVYGWGVKLRSLLFNRGIIMAKKLPCRVISIGNLTVGGTGKTPMTIYIAEMIREFGLKPAVISRGYKGAAEKVGGIVSDGRKILMKPSDSGDEPFMIAQQLGNIPVLVGHNRYQIGKRAVNKFLPDVIVLDDAFQHRQLYRDIDLVLVDDQTLFGNGHLLPRGILREPVCALMRADAFVLTRCADFSSLSRNTLEKIAPATPVFKAFHVPYVYAVFHPRNSDRVRSHSSKSPEDLSFLRDAGVFVFSGIAKNKEFYRMIKEKTKNVLGFTAYPDHYPYSEPDLRNIARQAEQLKADYIVTTEKDYARISCDLQTGIKLAVIGIKISFGNGQSGFKDFIRERLIK